MSVGGIKGGGGGKKAGGAGKTGGAGGTGAAGKAGGKTFGKVDQAESLVGASGLVAGGNVQGAEPVLTARAQAIAQMLKSGEIKSRQEATKRFVADILKEKMHMNSKALSEKIADALQDDPRLNQTLERLWSSQG
jgi:hypothetical protein